MLIHCLMAVETFIGCLFVRRRQVALLARHDYVLTYEREVGEVMIEADIGAPAFHVVTVLTLTPQPAGMHVSGLMTAVTIGRKLLGGDVRGMA